VTYEKNMNEVTGWKQSSKLVWDAHRQGVSLTCNATGSS
jgi:hypothetical protein